jgi:hypothetical protein
VELSQPNYYFNNSDIKAKLKITLGKYVLQEDKDYEIIGYENNFNVGQQAKVIYKSLNQNFSESADLEKIFTILPRDAKDCTIQIKYYSAVYTGEEIKPDIDVYLNDNMEMHYIYDDNYIDPEDYNLNMNAIKYPTIFKAGDLVYIDKNKHELQVGNYTDYYYSISKDKIFGIVGINQNEVYEDGDIDVCYFLNLSNQYVYFKSIGLNELQYVNYLDCHSHIDFGYIEKVDLNEVHPKIKDDYEYAKAKLIELGIIK